MIEKRKSMIFIISFLGLSISLIAWQLWNNWKKSYVLGITSFIFLGSTALSLFGGGFSIKNLGSLAISLIGLSVLSYIASAIKKIKLLRLPYLVAATYCLFLLSQVSFLGNHTNTNTVSQASSSGELLVQVDHKKESSFEAFAKTNKRFTIREAFTPIDIESTTLDDYFIIDLLDESPEKQKEITQIISDRPEVIYTEINEIVKLPDFIPSKKNVAKSSRYLYSDPRNNEQWALENINMNDVFRILKNKKPDYKARLFILDTGVDSNHEDLKSVFEKTKAHHDQDKKGHGTHCAGIASAMTGNGVGISSYNAEGVYSVSSIKVLADYGGGTQQGIIQGMIKAIDLGADVISMSLGGRSNDSRQRAYNQVVEYADKHNVIIVVAAGNSSENAKDFCPANTKGVITVAAIDRFNQKAVFSNTLEDIEMGVSAPGVDILSTFPGNEYKTFSGTSMATPYVAGLLTLMKSYKKELTTKDAFQLLEQSGFQSMNNEIKTIINPAGSLERLLK